MIRGLCALKSLLNEAQFNADGAVRKLPCHANRGGDAQTIPVRLPVRIEANPSRGPSD
jgi:hypothetical protein